MNDHPHHIDDHQHHAHMSNCTLLLQPTPLAAMSSVASLLSSHMSCLSLQLAEYDDREDRSSDAINISPGENDQGCAISSKSSVEAASLVGSCFNLPASPCFPTASSSSNTRMSKMLVQDQQHSHLPDLSISPLTASSYQTMERLYDQDTWRMHNRITTARTDRRQPKSIRGDSSLPRNGSSSLSGLNEISQSTHRTAMEEEEDDDEDALCIFDLDFWPLTMRMRFASLILTSNLERLLCLLQPRLAKREDGMNLHLKQLYLTLN